jgi:dTDP-4-amino-4,6-dideoxygalactose transaminase
MGAIPLSRPVLASAEAEAVARVLQSGWVTQGPRVAEFEKTFAQVTEAPLACAVSNCTTALHLALKAGGVEAGDIVITVSMSFIATANAIRMCGAEPVFVDIDPDTLNISPQLLQKTLEADFVQGLGAWWYRPVERLAQMPESPLRRLRAPYGRLSAILLVHQVGMPCDLRALLPIAAAFDIPVVEDAACALGSSIRWGESWQPIGRPHGRAACFSFHPRKIITTGDGGMITTSDPNLDRRFRLLRQHGMSVSDAARHGSARVIFEEYECTGFNYRMTDLQAAVGTVQLSRLAEMIEERRRLARRYSEVLATIHGIRTPVEPSYARTNWQSYQISLENPALQKPIIQALADRGISTRRGVMCAHLEAPYRKAWPAGCLPQSETAFRSGVILPLYPGMTNAEIEQVADALRTELRRLNGQGACAAA